MSLSVCFSTFLPAYLYVRLPIGLTVCLSLCISLGLFICFPVCLSLSVYLTISISVFLPFRLPVCISLFLSVSLSVYLPIYKHRFVNLSLCDLTLNQFCLGNESKRFYNLWNERNCAKLYCTWFFNYGLIDMTDVCHIPEYLMKKYNIKWHLGFLNWYFLQYPVTHTKKLLVKHIHKKCKDLFLNNQLCLARATAIDLNPSKLCYYPFMVNLDTCWKLYYYWWSTW